MRSRGAVNVVGEIVDDRIERRLAGAALQYLGGDRVGLEHPLRRKQNPAALRFVVRQPHAARQARAARRRNEPRGLFAHAAFVRHKSAWRHVFWRYIGVIERVKHSPEHAAFEFERREDGLLLFGCLGVAFDVIEREIGIALRPAAAACRNNSAFHGSRNRSSPASRDMRSLMMTGENISVSDEAMASSNVFSRTKWT